jgi:hypothetical protein
MASSYGPVFIFFVGGGNNGPYGPVTVQQPFAASRHCCTCFREKAQYNSFPTCGYCYAAGLAAARERARQRNDAAPPPGPDPAGLSFNPAAAPPGPSGPAGLFNPAAAPPGPSSPAGLFNPAAVPPPGFDPALPAETVADLAENSDRR